MNTNSLEVESKTESDRSNSDNDKNEKNEKESDVTDDNLPFM